MIRDPWLGLPEKFKFVGVSRVGRGVAFTSKPTFHDGAGHWVCDAGGETQDLGLIMDAVNFNEAPPMLTRPAPKQAPKDKPAPEPEKDGHATDELQPQDVEAATEELRAPVVAPKSLAELLGQDDAVEELPGPAPDQHLEVPRAENIKALRAADADRFTTADRRALVTLLQFTLQSLGTKGGTLPPGIALAFPSHIEDALKVLSEHK